MAKLFVAFLGSAHDHSLRKELLYSPRTQQFLVHSTTSAPDGAALITAAAASTPMTSPPPKYRSSAPLISGVRAQLCNMAASRIAALARGRAARKVARGARSISLARRFRPTATRSGAAVGIARLARSYLARRRFRRGGDRAAAAAAANGGIIVLAATTTSAPPPTPNARRGRRGRRTPTPDDSYHGDLGGYGSSDDDNDRSCFFPPGAHFERYKEYAHEAHKTFEPDLKGQMLMDSIISVNDDGTPKPLSSPSTRSNHGGAQSPSASSAEPTRVGTTWSQTGGVWWSASEEHNEMYVDNSFYEHDERHEHDSHHDENYDENDDDDGHDQDEEEETNSASDY